MCGYPELLQKAAEITVFGKSWVLQVSPAGTLTQIMLNSNRCDKGLLHQDNSHMTTNTHTHIFRYCNFNHSDSKLTVTGSGISKSTSLVTHAEVKRSQTFLFPFPFKPTNNTDTMSRNTEDILCVGRGQVDCSPSKP